MWVALCGKPTHLHPTCARAIARMGESVGHGRTMYRAAVARAYSRSESKTLEIDVEGESVVLHPAGAAFLPRHATLVVSDLHLEKASSFGRKGIFLPPHETGATLAALQAAIDDIQPQRVVTLGDNFHDRGGPERMMPADRDRLCTLVRARDWTWIVGNHDPELPRSLGGLIAAEAKVGRLVLRHIPSSSGGARGEIAGHLHPVVRISGGRRSARRRCFLSDGSRLLMPAFGTLAGGLDTRSDAVRRLFGSTSPTAFVPGDTRVYPVSANI